ncbi:MAG: hypothetical protein COV55_04455 [Candidatus Komeilibacteria bacterium CG11_big_fil_rev_8_21_14_0_20_36_20]|uniref:HTH HARE-type domain-containing protein n=2 Tax=Patescibacteria group TaxID=1783273 RepID=A0A2H0NBI3_9BACT|nr:MAG: hypothetical protein COV55_04455 [Candidatus Komeilibacteria bacterium CG11_big_fil_rev_8_21_14_0_20_36_20]PIR81702.1 MAG: hypothetical protein COU21_02020 [Candidatus Komeilibacteria bacterium CG10_big_fil_rev_8_21_14_0_10_36_65]PIZ66391.1 MAG: hypothetical protein COY14_00450 [Candidatus Roizmanbacteria bacterium CG_4_10_14_0_2_um_filter_36_9]PJC54901.1 MAG: hypothetical protein CO027_04835 [Candidatus Komeilibacteria bacterium CG_4_9_14_0_2_um_filter_36_13]
MDSILDQVLTSKHMSKMADFNPYQTLLDILEALTEREQEIIKMRHGLSDYEKKTLEDIGQKYKITRERVRQIENSSLKKIVSNFDQNYLKQVEEITNAILGEHGGMMSEGSLTKELLTMPGDSEPNRSAIRFILNELLKHRFHFIKESRETNSFWKTPEASLDFFDKTIKEVCLLITQHSEPLPLDKLMARIQQSNFYVNEENLTDKVVVNFIDITKKIETNPYDEWGLVEWPSITPRRMNDKIYLVLQKNKKPMHFTEIADMINQANFDDRQAYPATIHNELILDDKYVLIGRGIYALKDWGYKPGVVSDVIVDILKESTRHLSKKEIVEEVLKKRLIKKTTIALALMDKNIFTKDDNGNYSLKSA